MMTPIARTGNHSGRQRIFLRVEVGNGVIRVDLGRRSRPGCGAEIGVALLPRALSERLDVPGPFASLRLTTKTNFVAQKSWQRDEHHSDLKSERVVLRLPIVSRIIFSQAAGEQHDPRTEHRRTRSRYRRRSQRSALPTTLPGTDRPFRRRHEYSDHRALPQQRRLRLALHAYSGVSVRRDDLLPMVSRR